MFDRVEIIAKAGKGGDGAISFRHEKFVPFGGPDGGNGGDGGDVVIVADANTSSLRRYERKRVYKADNGNAGMGKKKYGRKGNDLVLAVPVGTLVSVKGKVGGEELVSDLEQAEQRVIVAKGGRGGWGNVHFASSTNQAPEIAQKGEVGEEAAVVLELRLIADVGIIGYPNVGKSTLLAAASAARPKIASYPFTTIEPILGVIEVGQQSFVLAEIPGLIEDAHLGRGLGHDFLRHAMRTKMLVHLIDGGSASPVEDMNEVNEELRLFDPSLIRKPQLVLVNKIDLPEVQARLPEIKCTFAMAGVDAFFISAASGEGVGEAMARAMRMLQKAKAEREAVGAPGKVFRPEPKGGGVSVHREGDTFVVVAPDLERVVARGAAGEQARWQLRKQFGRFGVERVLRRAGVKPGDRVRVGDTELEW